MKIIDLPAFILSPDTKKWSQFDTKLSNKYLFEKIQNVGFLLFTEQKNTRTSITAWKKTLVNFL